MKKRIAALLLTVASAAIGQQIILTAPPSNGFYAQTPSSTFAAMQFDSNFNLLIGTGTGPVNALPYAPPAFACSAQVPTSFAGVAYTVAGGYVTFTFTNTYAAGLQQVSFSGFTDAALTGLNGNTYTITASSTGSQIVVPLAGTASGTVTAGKEYVFAYCTMNSSGQLNTTGSGSGTVTQVSGDGTVTNGTITTSGSLGLVNAAQNSVLAGPATGGAGAPSYQTAPTFSAANLTNLPAAAAGTLTGTTLATNVVTGSFTSLPGLTLSTTATTLAGNVTMSAAAAASTPILNLTGAWETGGGTTGNYPQLYLNCNGATNPAFNSAGEGMYVNACAGYTGHLAGWGVNGSYAFYIGTTLVRSAIQFSAYQYATNNVCAAKGTAANPSIANCTGQAAAGHFSCDVAASGGTCTVDAGAAVTANSSIMITQTSDSHVQTNLGVTCNTTPVSFVQSASSVGTSFTITLGTFSTNPVCFSYSIVN